MRTREGGKKWSNRNRPDGKMSEKKERGGGFTGVVAEWSGPAWYWPSIRGRHWKNIMFAHATTEQPPAQEIQGVQIRWGEGP